MNIRKLRQDEIQEARKVFHNSINYEEVFISPYTDDGVAFRGGAMNWQIFFAEDGRLSDVRYFSAEENQIIVTMNI
jgi:hypothetical protein